jgi:hypothetical protein
MSKHTPGPLISWTLPGGPVFHETPRARDISDFGGAVEITATSIETFRIYRRENQSPAWVLARRPPTGNLPIEAVEFEPIEEFSRFKDALTEANRLARAAIAKARGE